MDCTFSRWVTCISQSKETALRLRNGGLGREGIGTSMMMQLVDYTIDTSLLLRRESDECLFEACS